MNFVAENIPEIIRKKDYLSVIRGMQPFIKKMVFSFARTKTPSCIVDEDDYEQMASLATIEAVNAYELPAKEENEDAAEYCERHKAKLISLCELKIRSKMIDGQKASSLPFQPTQKMAALHPKVKVFLDENPNSTREDVSAHFGVSLSEARELMELCDASFSSLLVTDGEAAMDKAVEDGDSFVVDKCLEVLEPDERSVVEFHVLGEKNLIFWARQNKVKEADAEFLLERALYKMRKVLCDGKLHRKDFHWTNGNSRLKKLSGVRRECVPTTVG